MHVYMEGQLSHTRKHTAKTATDLSLLPFTKDISVTEKKLMSFAQAPPVHGRFIPSSTIVYIQMSFLPFELKSSLATL